MECGRSQYLATKTQCAEVTAQDPNINKTVM